MRLALLSDQHANDVAFRAALEDVERLGVEEVVCLGDVVQGGAEPAETLDRLAALGCETVLGNADSLLLEVPADSPEPVTERLLEVREWTLSQLSASQLEQIRTFTPVVWRDLDGVSLLLFHGSPRSYDDVLLPEPDAEALEPFLRSRRGTAGGRTHAPAVDADDRRSALRQSRQRRDLVRPPRRRAACPERGRGVGPRHSRGRHRRRRVPPGAVLGRGRPGCDEAERPPVRRRVGGSVGS